jgi:transposase
LGEKKTGKSPVDRGKLGVKRSVAIEGHGVPVNIVIDGANRHDSKLLQETLDTLAAKRPVAGAGHQQHVCLDKGYDYPFVKEIIERLGFVGHVRPIGEERSVEQADPQRTPRRWKVERTGSWFNRFRGILIRWAKKPENYVAFLHLAAAAITLQQAYGSADCLLG